METHRGPEGETSRRKAVIVDVSKGVEGAARDVADARMTASKKEGSGVRGFFQRIWKHNLAHEYYRQKEIQKARQDIHSQKNIYAGQDRDRIAHTAAMDAIVTRFSSEYDGMLHSEAGERRETLEDGSEESSQIKERIQDAIRAYASGSLDDATFQEEKNRIFSTLSGTTPEKLQNRLHYVDNLLEIAKEARAAVEHGKGLNELDLDFDIVVGEARTGVRTEAQFSAVDKIVDKIQSSKVGRFLNETTVATAVSLAYAAGAKFSQSFARSKAVAIGTFGASAALAGGIAGLRESRRLEEERRQHARESAQGKTFDATQAPRRKEMEQFRYETHGANALVDELEAQLYTKDENGEPVEKTLDRESFARAVNALAEIEGRIQLSDREKVDLIQYSDVSRVEQERLRLDLARAKAKVQLRSMAAGREADLGIPDAGHGRNAAAFISSVVDVVQNRLVRGEKGMETRNRLFKKMKHKRVAKAVVKGVVTGVVIGGLLHEAHAAVSDDKESYIGQALSHFMKDKEVASVVPGASTATVDLTSAAVADATAVEGSTFTPTPPGAEGAVDASTFVPNAAPDSDTLIPDADAAPVATAATDAAAKEYVADHPDMFDRIRRKLWYDNDTPKPLFDKNEVRMHLGGQGYSGIDADGNFVFTMKHMTPDGSYHDGLSVDAQKLAGEGKLKLLLSMTRGTQNHVIEIPIDADGNAIIDPDSDVGKLLFEKVDGKMDFKGKFAEIAEYVGDDKDGVHGFRILATHVEEDGLSELPAEPVLPVEPIAPPRPEILPAGPDEILPEDVPIEEGVDLPPVFPFFPRTPLEPMRNTEFMPAYYFSPRETDPELEKVFKERRSKTLLENPSAKLDHYKEISAYLESLDPEYREKVESLAQQTEQMSEDNRLSVCIPVAGHQEEGHIYESLDNFTKQTADPGQYEIVLFVNQPDKDRDGNAVKPDRTADEIERFRKDHPEIQVRVMTMVIPIEQAKIGYVRRLLNDAVVLRQHQRGQEAPDLIMVSNDADNRGVAPEYIQNFISKFDANPEIDGFLGQLDWDPEAYAKYPLVHIGTRLFQYLNVIGRRRSGGMVSSGANFAFRSSIYAGIGGYLDHLSGAEDINIGRAIVSARDSRGAIDFAGARVSRCYTSARRAISALESGLSPVEQWSMGFSAFDDEIRRMTLHAGEDIDYRKPEVLAELKKGFEIMINRTLDQWESGEKLGKGGANYRKAIGWLGIEYSLDDRGEVVITDMSRLVRDLQQYQEYGTSLRDYKAGKLSSEEFKRIHTLAIEKYKKSHDDERIAKENEEAKIRTELEPRLSKFYSDDRLHFDFSDLSVTPDMIEDSEDLEIVGDYEVAKNRILSDNVTGKVMMGRQKSVKEEAVVIKRNSKDYLAKQAAIMNLPPDVKSVEEYLKDKKFSHPNVLTPKAEVEKDGDVVRIYEAGKIDLEKYIDGGKTLSLKQALSVIVRVSDGIAALHRHGVALADVAPSNIILDDDGAKLADLDGATIDSSGGGGFSKKALTGNRFIMPPELYSDHPHFGKTVDVYESAATLYRLIAGHWPYSIEDDYGMEPGERFKKYKKLHASGEIDFPGDIPSDLQSIIRKAMNPNPSDRYQSMEAFIAVLLDVYEKV